MNNKKIFLILAFVLVLLIVVSASPTNYDYSNLKTTSGLVYNSFDYTQYTQYNKTFCQEGQDFIIQVAPGGCTPTVVRSDLLEEEDVDVFCQLQAIKINPLVDVDAISYINFNNGRLPDGVRSIQYHPNRAALNRNGELNSMRWNNIGYIVVKLRQEINESAMPEFISGTAIADIRYDFTKERGLGRQTFYLPEMDDKEFKKNMYDYAFFEKRIFLRGSDINSDSAEIGVYSNRLNAPRKEGDSEKEKIRSLRLKKGQEDRILLPGYDCMASVDIKYRGSEIEEERAKLAIDSDIIEVKEGDRFLYDKCRVENIDKNGVDKSIEITCNEDKTGVSRFTLRITPRVVLKIGDEKKTYSIGDFLYKDNDGLPVYLGYASSNGNIQDNLEIQLVRAPGKIGEKNNLKLSEDEIKVAKFFTEEKDKKNVISYVSRNSIAFVDWLMDGKNYKSLSQGEVAKNIFDNKVLIISVSGGINKPLKFYDIAQGEKTRENYDSSIEDYDTVLNNFFSEEDPIETGSLEKLSEKGLAEKIELAIKLEQKLDVSNFCKEFESSFPISSIKPGVCDNAIKIANDGVSTKDVLIDGNNILISFEDVHSPLFENYGAVVKVKKAGIKDPYKSLKLVEDRVAYFSEEVKEDYIELKKLNTREAMVTIGTREFNNYGALEWKTRSYTLRKDQRVVIDDYEFMLTDINLNRVAKVLVDVTSPLDRTKVNFSFNIGVEKRAFRLSPEKTKDKIDRLNKTIKDWNKISDNLGSVVEGLKTACLATGSFLTIKNAVFNSKKSIARKEVMNKYRNKCKDLVNNVDENKNEFKTMDGCYFSFSDEIDSNVTKYYDIMQGIDSDVLDATKKVGFTETDWFKEKSVNSEALLKEYSGRVSEKIDNSMVIDIDDSKTGEIKNSRIAEILKDVDAISEGVFSIEDVKNIELYSNLNDKENLYLTYEKILKSRKTLDKKIQENERSEELGYLGDTISVSTNENSIVGKYTGEVASGKIANGAHEGEPIQRVSVDNKVYYLILEDSGREKYIIKKVYDENIQVLSEIEDLEIKGKFKEFKKIKGLSGNKFKEKPVVRFFSTAPYRDLPSFVPVDTENGWYAKMEYNMPSYGGIRAYDESGVLNSFNLCNVGSNGLIEDDDSCLGILTRLRTKATIGGLSESEMEDLVELVIQEVSKLTKVKDKRGSVMINGKKIGVGSPETGIIKADCSEFMSPKECKVLFNLCDPVICPTDRCDFGGEYKVRDVVQSGIVGSLALCLPNAKEGIVAPVCLTGVKAGIDSMLSTSEAYSDCLKEQLETGRTVGICDQKNSIYLCELLWKQAIPLAKIGVPKLLSAIKKENVRGGGTYANVESAWDNARDSIAFFTDSYALNSVKSFKSRSIEQQDIGGAVCKNFASMSYPGGQDFFKNLIAADSPHQFTAEFNEITQNTITNPPISHYKVAYNIYAGKDRGAFFKVWLRGSETSYYDDQDATRIVDSGYVTVDSYAAETIDFTAPAGYKELCISVNDQEECGFKKVSTSFSSNFFQDYYRKTQVNRTDINSEGECISGSPNLLALVATSNIQEGIGDVINPEIYNQGISRVCATQNPGYSTDPNMGEEGQRWIDVGNCGKESMTCWLDIETIDDAFVFEKTTEDLKEQFSDNYDKNFLLKNGYLDDMFLQVVDNITFSNKTESEKNSPEKRIELINEFMDKIFRNNNKAYLYYLRARAYAELAVSNFKEYIIRAKEREKTDKSISRNSEEDIYDIVDEKGFESEKLEVRLKGLSRESLCFKFINNDWYWSADCENAGTTFNAGGVGLDAEYVTVDWDSVDTTKSKWSGNANRVESKIIKELRDKTYSKGFEVIREFVVKDKSAGAFVMSENLNVKMDKRKLFLLSEIKDIDELYFIFAGSGDSGKRWYWGFEYKKELKDWVGLDKSSLNSAKSIKGDISAVKTLWNSLKNFGGISTTPSINVYEISEEYKMLITLLIDKNLDEGALILFSDKESWKRLSEKRTNRNRGYNPLEALSKLKDLEISYFSGEEKEQVLDDIIIFVEDLIEDKLLIPEGDVNSKSYDKNGNPIEGTGVDLNYGLEDSIGIEFYFLNPEAPDFVKIREELLLKEKTFVPISISGKLSESCNQYSRDVDDAAKEYGVDSNLIFAVMMQESRCGLKIKSTTGCLGIMQFCGPTASDYGLCDVQGVGKNKRYCVDKDDRLDESKSIDAGAKYLRNLLDRYDEYEGGKSLAIAAYNGGLGVIDRAIKNTENKINWKNVRAEITPSLLEEFSVYRTSGWDNEEREKKVLEIKDYVIKVNSFMGFELVGEENNKEELVNVDFSKILTISNSIKEIDSSDYASGSYSNNKKIREFVDYLKKKDFITIKDYNKIKDNSLGAVNIKSLLKKNKSKVEFKSKVLSLKEKGWPIKDTVNFIEGLRGSYSDGFNSFIVDELYSSKVIDDKQYKEINGEGFFNLEEDMGYVSSNLIIKAMKKTKKDWLKITNETFLEVGIEKVETKQEEECKLIISSPSINELSTAEEKVLATVEELDGTPRVGGIWDESCYTATQYIYNKADVVTEGNCIYSDKVGKKYYNGELVIQSDSKKFFYGNENCNNVDYSESGKLGGIKPGYLLSLAYNKNVPHNVIFIKWLDRSKNLAKVFDWNGEGKTYAYQSYDLSDDGNPVFMYWEPKI